MNVKCENVCDAYVYALARSSNMGLMGPCLRTGSFWSPLHNHNHGKIFGCNFDSKLSGRNTNTTDCNRSKMTSGTV